ncbi:MAG: cytochrome c maturation protein CcmE [Dehalococcoidia bacterium]|nr:cytochrome c maturation protein CcmE [Dehalococcoidia bacterium]
MKSQDTEFLDAEAGSSDATPIKRKSRTSPTIIKLGAAGVLLAFAIGYLVFNATRSSAVYYLTVQELRDMGDKAHTQQVRVSGPVAAGSIAKNGADVSFSIDDTTGVMPVTYRGIVPDIFQESINVVVEGSYTTDGVFKANTLLAMCPSRFESLPPGTDPQQYEKLTSNGAS